MAESLTMEELLEVLPQVIAQAIAANNLNPPAAIHNLPSLSLATVVDVSDDGTTATVLFDEDADDAEPSDVQVVPTGGSGGGGGFTCPISISCDDGTYTVALDTIAAGDLFISAAKDGTSILAGAEVQATATQAFAGLTSATATKNFSAYAVANAAVNAYLQMISSGVEIQFHLGGGDPNGSVTATKGSIFYDNSTPALYQNTDGATAWTQVGAGSTNYWRYAGTTLDVNPATTGGLEEFIAQTPSGNTGFYAADFGAGSILVQVTSEEDIEVTATKDVQIASGASSDIQISPQSTGKASMAYAVVREKFVSASVSGSVSVDPTAASVHALTMTGSITTLSITSGMTGGAVGLTLYLIQGGSGSYTVAWPGSVKWPGGVAPILSTTVGAIDIVVMESYDGGTTWFANMAGRGYA